MKQIWRWETWDVRVNGPIILFYKHQCWMTEWTKLKQQFYQNWSSITDSKTETYVVNGNLNSLNLITN